LCAEFNSHISMGWSLITGATVLLNKLNIVHYFMASMYFKLKKQCSSSQSANT